MTDEPTTTRARAGNLAIRLSSAERDLLNRAAEAEGRTVTQFLRFYGLAAARETIGRWIAGSRDDRQP